MSNNVYCVMKTSGGEKHLNKLNQERECFLEEEHRSWETGLSKVKSWVGR